MNQTKHLDILSRPARTRSRFSLTGTVSDVRSSIAGKSVIEVVERPETCPGAQVYISRMKNGKPAAMMFIGASAKPCSNYYYRNDDDMMKAISDFFSNLEYQANQKSERKMKESIMKQIGHGWEVGTVLQGSWGWEQTNQEFLKVVEASRTRVKVVRIGREVVREVHHMVTELRPYPDSEIGTPFWLNVSFHGGYPTCKYSHAYMTPADLTRTYTETSYA